MSEIKLRNLTDLQEKKITDHQKRIESTTKTGAILDMIDYTEARFNTIEILETDLFETKNLFLALQSICQKMIESDTYHKELREDLRSQVNKNIERMIEEN